MSDIETIVDPVERMTSVMARAAEAAELAVTQHGEKAVELALLAARVDALSTLVFGAVWAVVGLSTLLMWSRLTPWLQRVDWDDADSVGSRILVRISLAAVAVFCMVLALLRLASIKAWVGAFVPEYWIAAKALESIL